MKPLLALLLLIFTQQIFAQSSDTAGSKEDTVISRSMKEVIIGTARRPIEIHPDKTVLNIEAQPAAIGENALELLRRSPGVVVDASDKIGLNGKTGVAVYIDGKNTQLSGDNLAQLLKSIEGGNIKQIELITAPSAKYDAAGNAGIINIKLKKSLTDGFNGNVTGSYAQSHHARQSGSANLNWRKSRTALFFNGGLNGGLQHTIANNDRMNGSRIFTQRSIEKDFFNGRSVRAGADYSFNKKSTIGVLWMNNYENTRMDNSSTTLLQLPLLPDTIISTRSIAPFPTSRNSVNLNYAYTGNGLDYSMDADHTVFSSSVNNNLINEVKNSGGTTLSGNATQNSQRVTITLSSVKGDLAKTFPGYKLEAGFKLMTTRTDNSLQVQTNDGAQWVADTGRTNFFRYKESIGAAYASVKHDGAKFSGQIGLRGEYTAVAGKSTDLKGLQNSRPDTAYLNLFPTLFLQYQLSQKHQIGLTANRRIDRPSYQDQNPFIYALDALNSEQGNPYLMPQFTNSVEISYTYNYATALKVSYSKTTGYIEGLTYQEGKNTILIPQNAGTKQMVNFSFSTPLQPAKRWNVYASLTPYYHYYHVQLSGYGITEVQSGGSWGFNGYVNNTLTLGRGWSGTVSGWFNFQNRATIYISKPLGSLDVGIQKNILKEKATIKMGLVDVLNTQRWEQSAHTTNLQLTTYRKWESRNIKLGFSWRFGNTKLKKLRDRQSGSEEDLNRIK